MTLVTIDEALYKRHEHAMKKLERANMGEKTYTQEELNEICNTAIKGAKASILDEVISFLEDNAEYPDTLIYRFKQKYGAK